MLRAKREGRREALERRWYDDGVHFRCTAPECCDCCTGNRGPGYVWVSGEEMEAIAGYLDMPFDKFTRRYIRQVDWSFSLIETPENDCIFLTDGKCGIYEVRPTQCRTYPFWPEIMRAPETWQKEAQQCPGIGQEEAPITADEIDAKLEVDRNARKHNNVP